MFNRTANRMGRMDLERRFLVLQTIAKFAEESLLAGNREEEVAANNKLSTEIAKYKKLDLEIASHDD